MENIKWVFKCIKGHLDLINSEQQAALFVCTVNDQPSKEQGYCFKRVLEGRCRLFVLFVNQNTPQTSSSALMPKVSVSMPLLVFYWPWDEKDTASRRTRACGEEAKMISFQTGTECTRLEP